MTFTLRMAARELRASGRRLLLFFLGISLGVGGIVTVRSLVQSLRIALVREARTFTGADVVIQTNRPWDAPTRQRLERLIARAHVSARTESVSTATMARPSDPEKNRARSVELLAVDGAFPLYGEVRLADGSAYTHDRITGRGVLAGPELLAQLELSVGDSVLLGGHPFTVRGVLTKEPGRSATPFAFGPRVLMDIADLQDIGLLRFGSHAVSRVLLRVGEPEITPLVQGVRREFGAQYVSARSYRDTEGQLREGFQRTEDYLSLVAFIVLVLGGIGVSSVVRVFVHENLRTIAVLKCLGAHSRQVLAIYLAQVLVLGLAGAFLGVGLGALVLRFIPPPPLPEMEHVRFAITASAAAQGILAGLLVALLFSLVPLLDVRRVKPLLLLRPDALPRPAQKRDWSRWALAASTVTGLFGLAAWQGGSLRPGLIASSGFVVVAGILHFAGVGLVQAARRAARLTRYPLRHAILRISRPRSQIQPVLLAVGLGSVLLIHTTSMQKTLSARIARDMGDDVPDMFLIDIQPDQRDSLRAAVLRRTAREVVLIPVLRVRVTGVRGRKVNLEDFAEVRERGSLGREYVATWRSHLEPNERVLDGRFWGPDDATEPEVSIEEALRRMFAIQVGDEVRFDILGREVTARVSSVRNVEWSDIRRGGFMFVFRPGSLRDAPAAYIGFLKAPPETARRALLQAELAAAYPNVSSIDLRDILGTVRQIVKGISIAVSVVGSVTLFAGVLILMGAVAMTRFERRYETAIFRTLGASTQSVARLLALEYLVLGLIAGLTGSIAGEALTGLTCRLVFHIPWRPDLLLGVVGTGLTAFGVGVVGVAANLDVLRRKPLSVLRAE